jgi:hypothetical protein
MDEQSKLGAFNGQITRLRNAVWYPLRERVRQKYKAMGLLYEGR